MERCECDIQKLVSVRLCRKVAIPVLNDSPYIGMNVYNVVLTSIVVVSCQSLLSERTTLAFVVVATLIWTSTTTALCLLFIPKVLISRCISTLAFHSRLHSHAHCCICCKGLFEMLLKLLLCCTDPSSLTCNMIPIESIETNVSMLRRDSWTWFDIA